MRIATLVVVLLAGCATPGAELAEEAGKAAGCSESQALSTTAAVAGSLDAKSSA